MQFWECLLEACSHDALRALDVHGVDYFVDAAPGPIADLLLFGAGPYRVVVCHLWLVKIVLINLCLLLRVRDQSLRRLHIRLSVGWTGRLPSTSWQAGRVWRHNSSEEEVIIFTFFKAVLVRQHLQGWNFFAKWFVASLCTVCPL